MWPDAEMPDREPTMRHPVHPLTMFGCVALMFAWTVWTVGRTHPQWPRNVVDALVGVCFGLALALLALGLWRQRGPARRS
jgi:hypothetical protein